MCFVFFGVGGQSPRGQGQTWGGPLWEVSLGVLLGGPDCGGFARGEKLSRGVQLEGIDFDTLRGGRNCLGVASG